MADIQSQRLQRVYENAKKSLTIDTHVCMASMPSTQQATIYRMEISFRCTRNKWSIAKRYSEFFQIRRTLLRFFKQYKTECGDASTLPFKTLEDALVAYFPRRHIRGDTPAIIEDRKPALEAFVQLLVKVIACIPLVDAGTSSSPPVDARDTVRMALLYQILRDFLEYPDMQIESEAKLKLAVLSLEDVVVDSQSNLVAPSSCLSDCCSICLGEWDDEECVGMNVVKLPCLHAFHEDCLMEWLHGNTYCPMCREEPSISPSTSACSSSPSESPTSSH